MKCPHRLLAIALTALAWATAVGSLRAQDYQVLHGFDAPPRTPGPVLQTIDGTLYGTFETGGAWNAGVLYSLAPDGTFTILHHFGAGSDGRYPSGGLTLGSDGALYGTTPEGGASGRGTLFRWYQGHVTVLYSFDNMSGAEPRAGVSQATDGALYGTTVQGGQHGFGTLFKWDGETVTTLHIFSGVDGGHSLGRVVQGVDGAIYGTASSGGLYGHGTFFKWDGLSLATLHNFNGTDGRRPGGVLAAGGDGALYGTTMAGGPTNTGTLFRWNGTLSTVHAFTGATGSSPNGGVVTGFDGAIYGTTVGGGDFADGVLFRWSAGILSVVRSFDEISTGGTPRTQLSLGLNGDLYGTTQTGGEHRGGTLFKWNGSSIEVLRSFPISGATGPNTPLTQGADGAWYGITATDGEYDRGTLFKWDGALTVLHSFNGVSGEYPRGRLCLGADGALYGTTLSGGASGTGGTLFKWDGARLITLHSFGVNAADGTRPSGVIQGGDGAFYGTTAEGGANGSGTLFRWDGDTVSALYSFESQGIELKPPLVLGGDGLLYGITTEDGAFGRGGLVRWDGTGLTRLYDFDATTGGPRVGLTRTSDGRLWGTTQTGGAFGMGTLFVWDGASLQILHAFNGTTGADPAASVIEASDGSIYGTTTFGGVYNQGTIFKWDGQSVSVVHSFEWSTGARPHAAVTEGSDGKLYGNTSFGGPGGGGTLFRLTLEPPTQPTTLTVSDVTCWVGSAFTLQITLSTSGGTGIPAQAVIIDLDNDGQHELAVKTDGSGNASVTIPWDAAAAAGYGVGTFSARVAFAGSAEGYGASEALATIVVTKVPTILVLADRRTTYDGLPQPVSVSLFAADNTKLLPAVTYGGSPQAPVNAGTYAVEATFAGTDIYEAATGVATLTIDKATPVVTWQGPDGFTPAGDMLEPRRSQAMALLNDGRVLLAGADNFTRTAELFDPSTGTTTATGLLQRGRCYGCGTVPLRDGRIFIGGGWTGGPVENTAETYSPSNGTFILSSNGMQAGRIGGMAALLPDGRVLIAGGHNGSQVLASADIFNPAANQFTPSASLLVPRLGVAVTLRDGSVMFIGGLTSNGSYLATSEIYDPAATPAIRSTGSMTEGRHGHAAIRLFDGRVLVAGGLSNATRKATPTAELYVPETGTFTRVGDMRTARSGHVLVALPSGMVLVAGGTDANGVVLASAEIFNPTTGMFTPALDLQQPRTGAGAVLLRDGRVLIAGGTGANGEMLRTMETFGPTQKLPSIAYGTPLGPAQLNATASIAGQFAYTPPENTVLGVGSHTLHAQFTPSDVTNYEPAAATVTIDVRRAQTVLFAHQASTAGGTDFLIRATLYDEFGVGVSGRTLDFDLTNDGTYDVSSMTDELGTATALVQWSLAQAAGVKLGTNQMTVRFQGDTDYQAATSASAPLEIVDATPPAIIARPEGVQATDGWFTSDVVVSWSIVDAESAVTAIGGCEPTTISEDTNGLTLTCSASSAGGVATSTVTLKRDTTPPTIRSPVDGVTLERGAAAVLEWSCADTGIGVETCTSTSGMVSGTPIDTGQTGTFEFSVRAVDRLGHARERTITYFVAPATNAFVWAEQPDNQALPSPRYGHGMVYDSIRKKTILIGGRTLDGSYLNDVWERDSESGEWALIAPVTEARPIGRHDFGIAYDPVRQRVVVFSGRVSGEFSNVGLVGDTWEWNPATRSWQQIPTAGSPWFAGLGEPSLAWDPVGRQVILFGGHAYWGETNYVTYALKNGTWLQMAVEGPEGRARAAMTTDTRRQRVVLHSGWNRNPDGNWWMLNDTWEWDGERWHQVHAGGSSAPPARVSPAMVYDEARSVTVLFGGSSDGIFVRTFTNDTWEWNGQAWKQRQTTGSPSPRVTSMAYDQVRRETVLFGGNGTSGMPATGGIGDLFLGTGYEIVPVQLRTYPVETIYGQGGLFRAVLVGPAGPLSGRLLRFDLDADGDVDATATTDEDGNAALLLSAGDARTLLRVGTFPWIVDHPAEGIYAQADAVGVVTIARATPIVTLAAVSTTYDGTGKEAIAAARGVFGEDLTDHVTVTYTVGGSQIMVPLNAGVYTVTATFAGNEVYTPASATATFTISPAATQILIAGGSFSYDGHAHEATARVIGANGEDLGMSPVVYAGPIESGGEIPLEKTQEAPVDAGVYRVESSFPGTTNYLPSLATAEIVIEPAVPAISITGAEHVYDGQPHPTLAFATGVVGEDLGEVNVTYEPGGLAPVDAGIYSAVARYEATRNYASVSRAVQIVIHRASPTISVTGGTFTYDRMAHPAMAAAIGVQGEELSIAVQYSSGSVPVNAGSYQAVASFVGSTNYQPASKTTSIDIVRAVPTVSATGGTFGYDGQPHPATATVTGVGGEDLGQAAISYEPGGSVPVNAGDYVATATYSGSQNYEPAAGTAIISIARGAPTVRVAGGSFVYDAQLHPATGRATGINGDDLGPLTFTYNGSPDVPVHAGTYTVVGHFAGAGNYQAATATTTIDITRAPLVVTAQNATKVYGQPSPTFAAEYVGFVGNEGPQHLAGTLSFTTAAGNAAAVGSYAVAPSGVSSGDYAIAFVPGVLIVLPADSAITLSSSNNPAGYAQSIALRAEVVPSPAGAGVATGTVDFVLADGSLIGSSTVVAGVAVVNVILPPGSHGITAKYGGDANVRPGTAPLTQVVNDRQGSSTTELTVRPNSSSLGETVRLEARVTAAGTPTGIVEFFDGETLIGTGALASGRAFLDIVSLAAGAHVLMARYSGDAVVPGSSSSPVVHNVFDGSTKERTTVRISTRNARTDEPVVIEVRLASSSGVPSGLVSIIVDGQLRGTVTLASDGTASLTIDPLLSGEHLITALYQGSAVHAGSSNEVTLRVR